MNRIWTGLALALTAPAFAATFDADTLAFYPFTDKEVGGHLTSTAGEIVNAADNANYGGRGYASKAYGYNAAGEEKELPYVSDDVPGDYLFANANATEPLYGPGEWRSLVFPDHAAGYTVKGDETSFQPLATNTSSKTVTVTYRDSGGTSRQQGSATVVFAGLDKALGTSDKDWTIEFFLKHDSAYSNQQLLELKSYVGIEFHSLYGAWYQQYVSYEKSATSTGLSQKMYNASDQSLNLAECGWMHMAIVRSGTSLKLYRNYLLKNSVNNYQARDASIAPVVKSNSSTDITDDLLVGDSRTHYPAAPFCGRIAGLRITQRALDTSDFLVLRRAASTLEITGDYTVKAEGETYAAVIVSATARITGGPLKISNILNVTSGTVTFANEGLEFLEDTGSFNITVAEGATLNLDTVVSGDADEISCTGTGTTYLTRTNTFTGNLTLSGGGTYHAANDFAFGATNGYTWVMSDGNSRTTVCFDGVDIAEPFKLSLDNTSQVAYLRCSANTTNVIRGAYQNQGNCRINYAFEAGSHTVISNFCNTYSLPDSIGDATAQVDIHSVLNEGRVNFDAGTYRFFARHGDFDNRKYGIVLGNAQGRYVMERPYVFSASDEGDAYTGAVLRFSSTGTFDLNGHDQRVRSFTGNAAGHVVSEDPATLYVMADLAGTNNDVPESRQSLRATVEGAVSLTVESGTVPLDIFSANTSTGTLALVNGAEVAITNSGAWANGPVSVGAGCSLVISSGTALGEDSELTVADGGTVTLNASVTVKNITVAGEKLTGAGSYGPVGSGATHELAALRGAGQITIMSQSRACVWTGAGAGTSIQTDANWKDATQPDWSIGFDTVTFSESGEEATWDCAGKLLGITFARPAGGAFTLTDGGGTLTLGNGGITATDGTDGAEEGRHYTNNVPTALNGSQTWTLPGVRSEFVQNAPLADALATDKLTVKGLGALHLKAASPDFHGAWDFQADASLSGLVTHVWSDQSFGAPDAKVSIQVNSTQNTDLDNNFIQFHGSHTISNDIAFTGGDSKKLGFEADTRVVFAGKLDFGNTIVRPICSNGAEIVIAGGMKNGTCWRVAPPIGGRLVLTNAPCEIGSITGSNSGSIPADLDIYSTNNVFKETSYGFELSGNIRVNLHAPYAISRTAVNNTAAGNLMPKIDFRYSSGNFPQYDLGGYDQACSYLDQSTAYGTSKAYAVVTSSVPAQLEVYQHPNKTISRLAFTGAAGLTLEGPGTLTLNETPSPTTGRLVLKGGHLVLGASWPHAAEVALDSGSLALTANQTFGKRTTVLTLTTGGGTLDIGDTTQCFHEIRVDGVALPKRNYGTDDALLKGLVTGTGTLRAYGDGPGTALILR